MTPTCPRCEKSFVQRVPMEGMLERLAAWLYVYPYRCQLCTHRFTWGQFGERPSGALSVDRRQYLRFTVRFPVSFSGEARGDGMIKNVSMGGCAIETDVRLAVGKILRLQLAIPEHERPIQVEAAVVRAAHGTSTGLEFLRIAPPEKTRLTKYIAGLLMASRAGLP